jgi:hypothetical protein
MKKFFDLKPWQRAILFLVLYVGIVVGMALSPLSINIIVFAVLLFIIFTFIYVGVEIIYTLIMTGSNYVVFGLVLMIISVITLSMGFWENDSQYINKTFIISVAILAIYLTFLDFLEVAEFTQSSKRILEIMATIFSSILIIAFLMIDHPWITERVDKANTDYLTFISLGVAFSNLGLRRLKQDKDKLKKNE